METNISRTRIVDTAARQAAGRRLGFRLKHLAFDAPKIVGLSHGGALVAVEIARAVGAPVDVMLAREVTAPCSGGEPIGAAVLGDVAYFEPRIVDDCGLTLHRLERLASPVFAEVKRRTRRLRGRPELPDVTNRTVILVDDGSSTREQLLAAIWTIRKAGARRTIVALAIGSPPHVERLREDADQVYCFEASRDRDISFEPVSDEEVRRALQAHRAGEARRNRYAPTLGGHVPT